MEGGRRRRHWGARSGRRPHPGRIGLAGWLAGWFGWFGWLTGLVGWLAGWLAGRHCQLGRSATGQGPRRKQKASFPYESSGRAQGGGDAASLRGSDCGRCGEAQAASPGLTSKRGSTATGGCGALYSGALGQEAAVRPRQRPPAAGGAGRMGHVCGPIGATRHEWPSRAISAPSDLLSMCARSQADRSQRSQSVRMRGYS